MMKTVTMRLENANAELRVGDSNGIVIINNNNLVSIDELKEILSMFNYLNNSATETKNKKDATNFYHLCFHKSAFFTRVKNGTKKIKKVLDK